MKANAFSENHIVTLIQRLESKTLLDGYSDHVCEEVSELAYEIIDLIA